MGDATRRRYRRIAFSLFPALLCTVFFLTSLDCSHSRFSGKPESRDAERFGTVRIFGGAAAQDALVFLFSGAEGWNATTDAAARMLAASNVLVVGVDLHQYVGHLATSGDGCHYLISEIERLSQQLQRERGFPSYRSPSLAGFGQGGTLAYAALAQSPAATIAGAVALVPAPVLVTPVALCEGAKATASGDGGFRYATDAHLPGWWRSDAHDDSPKRLRDLVMASIDHAETREEDRIPHLPLVEYPAGTAPNVLAVIYSGDGGWRDLDKEIGESLAKRGIPVVGVDSLRYFWERKTPQQVADDLAFILRTYQERWGTTRAVLIGYSFGASVLPFAINRLPADLRASIVQTSLLGLGANAEFEVSVAEWLGIRPQATPVLPELVKLDRSTVQCFYGIDEDDTLCPSTEIADAEVVRTSGGHHFDGDYASLAERIVVGVERRGAPLTR